MRDSRLFASLAATRIGFASLFERGSKPAWLPGFRSGPGFSGAHRPAGRGDTITMATTAPKAPDTRSTASKRIRKIFGNIHEVSEMPNLIEVQRESYEQFLRSRPQDVYVSGLEKTSRSVFPIRDFAGTAEL